MISNKKIVLLSLIVILLYSCDQNAQKKKITLGTHVDSISKYHWGKGYYNTIVFYKFSYKGKDYNGVFKDRRKIRSYETIYKKGDSILITFHKENPSKSKIYKRLIY